MDNYYILDEQQYYVLMSMAMGRRVPAFTNTSIDISKCEVCGKPIKKAELSPYSVAFTETKDRNTGTTIIEGRASVQAVTTISPELMLDQPEMARKVTYEKICKKLANDMVEQLTWRFV